MTEPLDVGNDKLGDVVLLVVSLDRDYVAEEALASQASHCDALDDVPTAPGVVNFDVVVADLEVQLVASLDAFGGDVEIVLRDYRYAGLLRGGSVRLPQASAHNAEFAPGSEGLVVGSVLLHRLSAHWRRTGDESRRLGFLMRFVDMHLALAWLILNRSCEHSFFEGSQRNSTTISFNHGAAALAAERLPGIAHLWSYRSGWLLGRLRRLYALRSGPAKGARTISAV